MSVDVVGIDSKIIVLQKQIDEIAVKISQLKQKREELVDERNELVNEKRLAKSLKVATTKWDGDNFSWTTQLKNGMANVFKLKEFRPQQLKVINAFMSKQDVLLIAPTGGGKSLCYQLPGVIGVGLTLVVTPLISLMKDQEWSLQKLGVNVEILHSGIDKSKVSLIHKQIREGSGALKLLYVTPELLAKSNRLMSSLQSAYSLKNINGIAIDEVHCCSQWGHDYRPDYKFLGSLKMLFPDCPILGVTATATKRVIIDVQNMLNIPDCLVLRAPFNRPNLYYHVLEKPSNKDEVLSLLEDLLKKRYKNQTGIIYTFSIKDSEDIASGLLNRGCSVRAYHAKLEGGVRNKRHSEWLDGSIQAVIATIAFGMGIDKPDVRFVIHHTMSKSIENYYQESGRAGRDGKYAECVLLFRFADMFSITSMVFTEQCGLKNAYAMIDYATNGKKCRREILSGHFAEVWDATDCEKMCDRCLNWEKYTPGRIDIRPHLTDLLKIIQHAEKSGVSLTGLKLLDAWYHKGAVSLRINEISVPKLDRHYGEQVVTKLVLDNYLKEDFHFTAFSTNSYIKRGGVCCSPNEIIEFQPARVLHLSSAKSNEHSESESTESSQSKSSLKTPTSSTKKKSRKRSLLKIVEKEVKNEKRRRSKMKTSENIDLTLSTDVDTDTNVDNGDDDDITILDCNDEVIELE